MASPVITTGTARTLRTRSDWARAAEELAGAHRVADELHHRHGPPDDISRTRPAKRFASLCEAIVHQQLTGRAARTIWGRVTDSVGDPDNPAAVLATGRETLLAAGLSKAKAAALIDLATHCRAGSVDLGATATMADDDVIGHLTQVRGVGPWTAQMFLIFDLGRPDVWPAGDLGVRNGWAVATGGEPITVERSFATVGDQFAPFRSVLAWWCWREVDGAGRNW